MYQQSKGNMRIDGMGTQAGGCFDRVEINGLGTLKGRVEADEICVSGAGTFQGEVQTQRLNVDGTATFHQDAVAQSVTINGNAKFKGNLQTGGLDINGNLKIEGHVRGENVTNEGRLIINGSCEAESFKSEGQVKVLDGLNAETVELNIALKCEIKEIGGSQITVRRTNYLTNSFVDAFLPTGLYTNLVEGDLIELEYTDAATVRGHDVFIGPGCTVDLVEYSGKYEKSPTANVREVREVM